MSIVDYIETCVECMKPKERASVTGVQHEQYRDNVFMYKLVSDFLLLVFKLGLVDLETYTMRHKQHHASRFPCGRTN